MMNALRQIIDFSNVNINILLPKEYQSRRLEVIILPLDETEINSNQIFNIKTAHEIIDLGGGSEISQLILNFDENRKNRDLPYR